MAWGDGLPAVFEVSVDELVAADVVRVAGELDLSTSPQLAEALSTLPPTPGRDLVLDFSAVSFIDSTALGLLVMQARRRLPARVSIVLESPELRSIFEITGLDRHFDFVAGATAFA